MYLTWCITVHVLPLAPSIAVNRASTHSVENALFRTRFFPAASGDRIFFHSMQLLISTSRSCYIISGSHMTITIIIVFRGGLSGTFCKKKMYALDYSLTCPPRLETCRYSSYICSWVIVERAKIPKLRNRIAMMGCEQGFSRLRVWHSTALYFRRHDKFTAYSSTPLKVGRMFF